MWHITLEDKVENETTRTLVVNWPDILHTILNLYELPSKDNVIHYLHGAAGFMARRRGLNPYELLILSRGQS